jgi:acyl-CoA dehydrogenase
VAVPYLKLFGTVAGGWMMARAALVAQEKLKQPDADRDFLLAKLATARFYAEHELPRALPLAREVTRGADSVLALDPAKF